MHHPHEQHLQREVIVQLHQPKLAEMGGNHHLLSLQQAGCTHSSCPLPVCQPVWIHTVQMWCCYLAVCRHQFDWNLCSAKAQKQGQHTTHQKDWFNSPWGGHYATSWHRPVEKRPLQTYFSHQVVDVQPLRWLCEVPSPSHSPRMLIKMTTWCKSQHLKSATTREAHLQAFKLDKQIRCMMFDYCKHDQARN